MIKNAWNIFKYDLKIIRSDKLKLASLLAVILIPLVYGFMYLWAFWDPYDNMKNVPVAIVNGDEGAWYKNEEVNFGQQIVDGIMDKKVLDWQEEKKNSAVDGLNNQEYYAVVYIPGDFSQKILSVDSDDPKQASIEWQTKDSTSYIFTTYFRNVMAVLNQNVNEQISKQMAEEVGVKVGQVVKKLSMAGEGASELSSGLQTLDHGSQQLKENLDKAVSGVTDLQSGLGLLERNYQKIDNGISTAKNGSDLLKSGLETASDGGEQLSAGLKDLRNGGEKLQNGVDQAESGSQDLAAGANEMYNKVDTIDQELDPFVRAMQKFGSKIGKYDKEIFGTVDNLVKQKNKFVDGQKQIADGSSELADGLNDIDKGMLRLNDGISSASNGADSLSDGMDRLYDGSGDLSDGLGFLQDGSTQFDDGLFEAYEGSGELKNGMLRLADGSGQLASGLRQASVGAETLSDELNSGVEEIKNKINDKKIEKLMKIAEQPVVSNNVSVDSSKTYGEGLAPYFIPLALWMGSLIASLLFSVKDKKMIVLNVDPWSVTLGKFAMLAMIGGIQTVVLILALVFGLGMDVKYLGEMLVFGILVSWSFMAIMSLLSYFFGKIGELLGIIFLVIQLTSSSGTFPVLSSDNIFQFFSVVTPMPYAVRGLRILMLGGNMEILMRQLIAIVLFLGCFLWLKNRWSQKTIKVSDIYPLIEI